MSELVTVKDIKKEVEFWLNAINNSNIDEDNKKLLNICLYSELHNYLYPVQMTVNGTTMGMNDFANFTGK